MLKAPVVSMFERTPLNTVNHKISAAAQPSQCLNQRRVQWKVQPSSTRSISPRRPSREGSITGNSAFEKALAIGTVLYDGEHLESGRNEYNRVPPHSASGYCLARPHPSLSSPARFSNSAVLMPGFCRSSS